MKKFNVFAFFFLSFIMMGSLQAQDDTMTKESKAYVRFNVGYGFGNGGSQPAGANIITSIGSNIFNQGEPDETRKNIYGSLGKGLQANLALGYKFNKYFSGEFAFVYMKGSSERVESFTYSDGRFDRSEVYTNQFQIRPGLVFEADNNSKLVPYARVSLIVPVSGGSFGERESNDPTGLADEDDVVAQLILSQFEAFEAESVARGMPTLGFEGTLGIKYKVTDRLNIHAELFHNALRVKRKTYEVTRATLIAADGSETDAIPLLSIGGIYPYTEYKDEINASELAAYQAEAGIEYGTEAFPAWELREDFNFNSLGLSIGVSFNF